MVPVRSPALRRGRERFGPAMRRALGVLGVTVAIASLARGQVAAAPAQGAATDAALLPYAGAYVLPPRHELVIALQRAPNMTVLVLYDIATDLVRVLVPAGRDTFVAGRELTRPQPPAFTVVFRRERADRITALSLSGAGWPEGALAQRRELREEATDFAGAGVSLSGSILSLPNATARRPAVVLVHGSEDADRYSFGALPYLLASHGFVTLTFDKRGTGRSNGDWSSSGLEELAADVRAAVSLIARRADVDSTRIGLVGLSEGGWTAPLAAWRGPAVAFIVAISGGGLTKADAFIHKNRVRLTETGLTGVQLDSALADALQIVQQSRSRVVSGNSPSGFDRRLMYDPSRDWQAFRGPILSLGGEADALEDALASAQRLEELLHAVRHSDFTIKVFPRAHHGALFLGRTGKPSEWYGLRGITQIAPGVWDVLLLWLDVRFAP